MDCAFIAFRIREATEEDFTGIVSLLHEFALFQKTPERMKMTVSQLQKDKSLFQFLLAVTNEDVMTGYVCFFPVYYSWSGKAMYIDDLFVKEAYRNNGIGKALLQSVIAIAKENGSKKVRWQVSGWNKNAIDFYKSLGAVTDDTEQNCDLIF